MREILFRGQDAITREWIYGCYVDNRDRGRCPPIIVPKNGNPHIYVFPETVGQFTGITDKNGKHVFEGDIVAFTAEDELWEPHYYQGFVYFCDGIFWVDCGKDRDDNDVLFSIGHVLLADKNLQIIGNIHDNPELLTTT